MGSAMVCGFAHAGGPCVPDWTGDGATTIFDLIGYLEDFAALDPATDLDHDGTYGIFDVVRYLEYFSGDPALDSDGDRLPDAAELGGGVFRSPCRTGTDPFDPDTDADGKPDGDEALGTLDGLDLPALGADPLRRDIFIEVDWYAGNFGGLVADYRPLPQAVARVEAMFANAPVSNPDGSTGIDLHIDYGQNDGSDGPYTGGSQLPGALLFVDFGPQFLELKAQHFEPNREGYFHYAIFAHRHSSATNRSSGIAEINGDDFMVTMVDYLSVNNQANTLAHELGHNLGLRHGGFENRNRKPNYNSVMNYRHQFPGVDVDCDSVGDRVLDYSHGLNLPLDESTLIESEGVCGGPAIDWNRNGVIDPFSVSLSINCSGGGTPCGTPRSSCYDSSCDVLHDHNDWLSIRFDRLNDSDRVGDPTRSRELSDCDNWPGK